ncbi:glycoside hydrolase family 17 protein [Xylona heveae TC161]|uniref:glucan 1,3-beta-glucosidase n=1 Tax=Xylona heveae (strain CBS 132557 / TC161) TaxID=1328760 RepID=A0A165JPI4_XYLHT|nr:glycoside hydrolase family 17 protein [Xylona heveae TC161]KZF26483.1 glycoside hydrolase family 17 protein [Xylona heveae TC161]
MRFSSVVPLALAAAPAVVSAAGTLGFALGDKKADGSCKYTADYEADFDTLAGLTKVVRGYSASDCNTAQQILPAAKNKGFQVLLGVWPDTDASFAADKAALQAYVPQYEDQVYAITVGSESMYRGTFTGAQLLEKINDIKGAFPNVLVGTADSWNKYADGTGDALVTGGVDLLLINAFAYWQGQDINNASATFFDDVSQAFGHIQSLSGSTDKPKLAVGETGWVTSGGTYGSAVPSAQNAQTFYKQGICGILDWGVDVYYFEAFDEPWKPVSKGDNGEVEDETAWGAYTVNRVPKFDLSC